MVASGCTDNTEAIVVRFAKLDPRVLLLRQAKREGKASAVNLFMATTHNAEIIVLSSVGLLLCVKRLKRWFLPSPTPPALIENRAHAAVAFRPIEHRRLQRIEVAL